MEVSCARSRQTRVWASVLSAMRANRRQWSRSRCVGVSACWRCCISVGASREQNLLAHKVKANDFRSALVREVALNSILHLAAQLVQCIRLRENRVPQRLSLETAFGRLAHNEDYLLYYSLECTLQFPLLRV